MPIRTIICPEPVAVMDRAEGARAAASGLERADLVAGLLLTIAWIAPIPFIGTHGEFPLSDDWAYAWAVKHLLETGEFARAGWTFIPLITHTILGWCATAVFGFSFQTLRCVDLVFGWVGVMGLYALARQVGAGPRLAGFAALLLAISPIYFSLSYTFMTDIPFVALLIWGMLFLVRSELNGSAGTYAIGLALATAATLSRQFGLALPAGYALMLVITRPRELMRWVRGGGTLLFVAGAYALVPPVLYRHFMTLDGDRYFLLERTLGNPHMLYDVCRNGTHLLMHVGLLLSPVALLLLGRNLPKRRWWSLLAGTMVFSAIICAGAMAKGWRLPGVDVVFDTGLGSPSTPGDGVRRAGIPTAPFPVWWMLSIAGVMSACYLLFSLVDELWRRREVLRRNYPLVCIAATIFVYMAGTTPWRFDRYMLPILPLSILLVLYAMPPISNIRPTMRCLAMVALLLIGAFSIVGTRDHLQRHRVRWALLADLSELQVTPDRIDGGFEFNAWFNYGTPREARKRHWVIDDEYLVSGAPAIGGYDVLDEREFTRLFPPGRERIRLFHRNPAAVLPDDD